MKKMKEKIWQLLHKIYGLTSQGGGEGPGTNKSIRRGGLVF